MGSVRKVFMKTKRFLCILLVAFLLLPLMLAGAPAQATEAWSEGFERFVLNQEYLSTGLAFSTSEYFHPLFTLCDIDRNGTPELIVSNGLVPETSSQMYVFSCENGQIRHIGSMRESSQQPYRADNASYPGIFVNCGASSSKYQQLYYTIVNGQFLEKPIQIIDNTTGSSTLFTNDSELYAYAAACNASNLEYTIPFYSLKDIRAMGWEAFVQKTIGSFEANVFQSTALTSVVPTADDLWYTAYERFILNQEYLASDWKSILKFSTDVELRFSLYDIDNNGTPELIAEGGQSNDKLKGHVFSCNDGRVNYCGAIGCNPYHYGDSSYPGLFTTEKLMDENQVTYYTLVDGTLTVNSVRTITPSKAGYDTSKKLTYDHNLYAWSLADQKSSLVFCSLSEIRVAGWQRFVIDTLWDSINLTIGELCAMSPEQQYAANLFLSNFSEQGRFESYAHRFDANDWHLDDLVNFAYLYCKINKRDYLSTAQNESGYFYSLSLENANTVWARHFGLTLDKAIAASFPQKPSADPRYPSYYSDGVFYFPAADGERFNDFTVVRQMEKLEDGSYRMLFDIYKPDLHDYWSASEASDTFYRLTPDVAVLDSRITYEASGVAIVWPYVNNGNATYQLFRYAVPGIEPVPVINDEERIVEYKGYSTEFGPAELIVDSTEGVSNHNLCLLCAMLSEASYSTGGTDLIRVYQQMFGEGGFDSEFNYKDQVFCSGIALGKMKISDANVDTNVLFVTIKGTAIDGTLNLSEVGADLDDASTTDRLGYQAFQSIIDFEEKIQSRIDILLKRHPEYRSAPLKIVITGHSLGGATANLLSAILTKRIEEDASLSAITRKGSIFCYTFGAIDSINIYELKISPDAISYPITSGFENIHNIYNLVDSFGPYQMKIISSKLLSGYGKFGHIDLFSRSYSTGIFDFTSNHMMGSYLNAVSTYLVKEQQYKFNKVWVRCPVDVEVYKKGVLLGKVHDNTVELLSDEIGISVYEDVKMIICPSDRDYSLRLTATDDGSMEYSVESFSSDSVDIKTFSNVALTKGKTMYSELRASTPANEIRLQLINTSNIPITEIQPDGSETAIQESEASVLPKETVHWLIIALAGLAIGLICLITLLTTRRMKPASKSTKRAPSDYMQDELWLPAFSTTHCCVCGHKLKDEYRVFFRNQDGKEARLDNACVRQLNILRKSEDRNEIHDAIHYIRGQYNQVDPLVARRLQKFVKEAEDYLSQD